MRNTWSTRHRGWHTRRGPCATVVRECTFLLPDVPPEVVSDVGNHIPELELLQPVLEDAAHPWMNPSEVPWIDPVLLDSPPW
jgi:hypothetical protein